MDPAPNNCILRFGVFEFDQSSGELRKNGLRIRLQGQPMQVLGLLLKTPGQLVHREEFQKNLWPAETFVDFERGLNASVTRLRVALGESAGLSRFVETVPRRGYRFIAPVQRLPRTSAGRGSQAEPGLMRLMVAPFDQLQPDPETAFLCFSLPDAIISSLAGFRSLVTCGSRSARRAPAPATVGEISEEDVDAVITGTILRSGQQIRVSVQLSRASTGAVMWTHVAQVPMGEVFWLQDELMRRILASLVPSVADPNGRATARDVPATARAYEFYLRANYLATQMRDLTLAREMYLSCLAEDPEYAPAWARLARCYRILAKFRADREDNVARADEAFERAFSLNPDLPGLHCLFAHYETDQGRAKDALIRLLQALRHNPHDPDLYTGLVYSCRYAGLVEASIAAHEAGRRLDRHLRTSVMHTHFAMGNHRLALEATSDDVGLFDAMFLDGLGRRQEALERVRGKERLPPLLLKWMKMLELYLEDRHEEAVALLLEIDQQAVDPEGFFYRARIFARIGRIPEALTSLERAQQRGFYCALALCDPYLSPLQGGARFERLVAAAMLQTAQARMAFVEAGGDELLPAAGVLP